MMWYCFAINFLIWRLPLDTLLARSSTDEKLKSRSASKICRTAKTFDLVSLFSGCGGMDLGFKGGFTFLGQKYSKQPFRIKWANEINAAACRTYRRNVGKEIVEGDIWCHMESLPKTCDVVVGGFPCQDISINGKGAGIAGERSGLYRSMVKVVQQLKPKIFVAENVKGLLMRPHREALKTVMADFERLGYSVRVDLYLAAEYGVPQTRERVLIIGVRENPQDFAPPAPTYKSCDFITAKMAISDLAEKEESEEINHIWSRANRSPDQGDRRLKADRPGYTIRAECHGNIQWHYERDRRISMREAARLQSFPDDFVFDSKLRETERQVGNAVPPVFAWHVANSVKSYLRKQQIAG